MTTKTEPQGEAAAHYTDGRRWSYLSNAWILKDGWNDQEEIAMLRAQLAKGEAAAVGEKWRSPTCFEVASPEFNAIWDVIKRWDVNVPSQYRGYCGANGNHVIAILDALRPYLRQPSPVQGGVGDVGSTAMIKAWKDYRDGKLAHIPPYPPDSMITNNQARQDAFFSGWLECIAAMHTTDAPDMGESSESGKHAGRCIGTEHEGSTPSSPTTTDAPAVQLLSDDEFAEIDEHWNKATWEEKLAWYNTLSSRPSGIREAYADELLGIANHFALRTPSPNAAPSPPMTAWQDIECAPIGPIWLWCPEWKMATVGRRLSVSKNAKSYHRFKGLLVEGWHECNPTKWTPLPASPLPAKPTGGDK